ncbi:MAG: nucleotidyltransferase family protein [Nitrospirae bacterium]|nr:nucleotidyltransferase family protein [Nitrospirota bacterium]
MDTLDNIKNILNEHREEIRERFYVKEIGIFGSYVRGEQKDLSDIDILVDYEEAPGLFEFVRLKNYLSDLLGLRVDLVMKTALKPTIGKHILKEVVVV